MLGNMLVTTQTGPSGKVVRRVLVEEGCDIARELYFAHACSTARSAAWW